MLDIFDALLRRAKDKPSALALASFGDRVHRAEMLHNIAAASAFARAQGIKAGDFVLVRTLAQNVRFQVILGLMAIGCRVAATQSLGLFEMHGISIDALISDDPEVLAPQPAAKPAARRVLALTPQWFAARAGNHLPPAGDHALIFASSGSTGSAKLIEVDAAALSERVRLIMEAPEYREGSRFLVTSGNATSTTFRDSIATLVAGGAVLRPHGQASEAMLDAIKIYQPSFTVTTPLTVRDMLRSLAARPARLKKMELLRITGAFCPADIQREAASLLAEEVVTSYGSTELCSATRLAFREDLPPELMGRLKPGFEAMAADDQGRPLPAGAEGHLRIRSRFLISGAYLHAGTHRQDALADGWFAPGDIGRVDAEGNLYVSGRAGLVLNIGGEKLNPELIEAAAASYPGIADIGIGAALADGIPALAAAIVSRRPVDLRRLNEHLSRHDHRIVVHSIKRVDGIPRTASGKVDRQRLETIFKA